MKMSKLNPKLAEGSKVKEEIHKIEDRKTIKRFPETNSCFFEKINKIDKPLSQIKKKGERRLKLLKSERGDFATDFTEGL